MTLDEIIQNLNLTVLTGSRDFSSIHPASGYASDLLSCVMAGAKPGGLWITLQVHMNIVAVASLTEVSAIIITEGAIPEPDVIDKANTQGVILLSTSIGSYSVAGKLWESGLR